MRYTLVALAFGLLASTSNAHSACRQIDLDRSQGVSLSGMLTFQVFPGPPNFTDVRSGDQPEPAFILNLDEALCVSGGDQGRNLSDPIATVHLLPPLDSDPARIGDALRADKGRHVEIRVKQIDLALTAHYHAPLSADVTAVTLDGQGVPGMEQPGTTTAEGFYTALAAGDGTEAAKFVLPELRSHGPLSANAMSAYYSTLPSPLKLKDVRPLSGDTFEATYAFTSRAGVCDGRSVVTTERRSGLVLISRIRSLTGC